MANNTSLSILRDTPLTSNIATEAWTSENFTFLSTTNDLSNKIVSNLSNVINTKLSTIADEVSAEVQRVDEISTSLSNYSLTSHTHSQYATRDDISAAINTLDSEVTGEAGAGKTLTSFSQTDGKVTAGFADIAITKSQVTDFPTIPTVSDGILTIQKNGTAIASFSANQSTNVSANISVPTKTSELTNDSGFVVSSDLIKVMEYQGSVTTYNDLPSSGNKQGDVWNVVSAYNENPPGTNYAWNGTTWDPLGGNIDVSNFATKSQLTNYLPLSGGSMTGALSANSGFRADGYGGSTGLSIGNGENDEYYTRLIANVIKTAERGGAVVFENGYGYGLSVDAGWTSDFYGTYLNATKVKSEELFVNADVYGGGLSVGQGTDDIYGTYIDATNLTAPGMIAGNSTAPHGGLSVTGIDFGDGSYLSSANGFASISALNDLSAEVINGLSNEVLPKLSTIGDLTIEQSQKINAISATYISGVIVNNTPKTVTNNVVDLGTVLTAHQSLSGYTPLSTTNDLISTINDELSGNINPKISSIADEVSAETAKLDELSGSLSAYAKKDEVLTAETDPIFNTWLSGESIAAGNAAVTDTTGVAIGLQSNGGVGVAIGANASVGTSNGTGVAIGTGATSTGRVPNTASTAVGRGANAAQNYSMALGTKSVANAISAIQLGTGTNSTAGSLQVWDYRLLDGNGNIPEARVSAIGYIKGADVPLSDYLSKKETSTQTISGSVQIAGASNDYKFLVVGTDGTVVCLQRGDNTNIEGVVVYDAATFTGTAMTISSLRHNGQSVLGDASDTILTFPPASENGQFVTKPYALSTFALSSTVNQLSNEVVVEISSVINPKLSTIISLVSSEVDKLDEISGNLSNYVDLSSYQQIAGQKVFKDTLKLSCGPNYEEIWLNATPGDGTRIVFSSLDIANQTIGNSDNAGLYFQASGKSKNAQTYVFPGGVDQYDAEEQIIATERYAKQARNVLPILAMTSSTVNLSADTYVYRVTDSNNTGTFPTLVAPTDIVQTGDYYFTFEIEWTTAASLASYAVQYDWINYPEMQTDGQQHTYYITGRWDSSGSGATAFTLNCWRTK